jgi:calcineurin-like phosphoesterase family protein
VEPGPARPALNVFFTADSHFGHGGALGLYRRPFASVAEMDAALVARWNATVGAGDEVWHLGDFALGVRDTGLAALLDGLNGRKHLITGNNDGPATTALAGWATVAAYAEIAVDGHALVLCHYPFRTWRGSGQESIDLHGHSHGRLKGLAGQYDVGVDVHAFRPVTLDEILGRA